MLDRSWNYLPGLAAVALLPLAVHHSENKLSLAGKELAINIAAHPVRIATVMRPLDLDVLTIADFGDGETHR